MYMKAIPDTLIYHATPLAGTSHKNECYLCATPLAITFIHHYACGMSPHSMYLWRKYIFLRDVPNNNIFYDNIYWVNTLYHHTRWISPQNRTTWLSETPIYPRAEPQQNTTEKPASKPERKTRAKVRGVANGVTPRGVTFTVSSMPPRCRHYPHNIHNIGKRPTTQTRA